MVKGTTKPAFYKQWLAAIIQRISTLNDMPRSNTEGEKRTNNHHQNAESSLERYFHYPYIFFQTF